MLTLRAKLAQHPKGFIDGKIMVLVCSLFSILNVHHFYIKPASV